VPLLAFAMLALFLVPSCASFTKQDAIHYGERVGLAAADTAILLAHMQLASAEAELNAAMMQSNAPRAEIAMKRLAVLSAKQALDAATRAVAKRRATLDAKQPRDVTPEKMENEKAESRNAEDEEPRDQLPACLRVASRLDSPFIYTTPRAGRGGSRQAAVVERVASSERRAPISFPRLGAQVAAHLTITP
jgi:hypothetical protein